MYKRSKNGTHSRFVNNNLIDINRLCDSDAIGFTQLLQDTKKPEAAIQTFLALVSCTLFDRCINLGIHEPAETLDTMEDKANIVDANHV